MTEVHLIKYKTDTCYIFSVAIEIVREIVILAKREVKGML